MLTSEYLSCTGIYKTLVAALISDAPSKCILVVGGPGCGKSTFSKQLLVERGYNVADVSDICEREAMVKRVKTFCDTGGVDMMVQLCKFHKKVIWLDDNLQMGTAVFASASAFGVPIVATSSARNLSKYPTFRKRCTILKMNYPNKTKCLQYLHNLYPAVPMDKLAGIVSGVNGSVPRALNAIEQIGVADYIEDRRKMDMNIYEVAESTLKMAKSYCDVKTMTSSEPVMLSIIMQEMSPHAVALKHCNEVLALGDYDLAEISCFSGFLYASRRTKARFPRCYSLASSKASAHRKTGEFAKTRALVPWETAFLYTKRREST